MVDLLTVFQKMHNLVKIHQCKKVNKQNKVNKRATRILYKIVIILNQQLNSKIGFLQFQLCF